MLLGVWLSPLERVKLRASDGDMVRIMVGGGAEIWVESRSLLLFGVV